MSPRQNHDRVAGPGADGATGLPGYRRADLPVDARVADLIGRMTLAEKAGQLNQHLYGWQAYRRLPSAGPGTGGRTAAQRAGGSGDLPASETVTTVTGTSYELTDTLRDEVARFGGLGALYGLQRADGWSGVTLDSGIGPADGAEVCRLVQRYVVEHSRLGIPALFVEEAPHGIQALGASVLPVGLTAASTWDPELHEETSRAVAAELRLRGAHVALVSGLDVLRDPRWGRAEETFGEDPVLAAELVRATVTGMQGAPAGPSAPFAPLSAAVVVKHAAGQGAATGGRNWAATEIGWRELYEIHLPPVRAAVSAGAAGLMAAYTEIDGLPCAASPRLLGDIFRGELGFSGLVMADGTALDRLVRLTGDPVSAAAMALRAGTDLSLWDEAYTRLAEAVDRGLVDETHLDAAVGRVLRLKFRLGLFDVDYAAVPDTQPVPGPAPAADLATAIPAAPAPDAAARLGARQAEGAVTLLSNDGTLPLTGTARVAVVGPHSDTVLHALGDYTAPQPPGSGTSLLAALRATPALSQATVTHTWGARLTGDDGSGIPRAVELAAEADVVVVALGGSSAREVEARFDDNGAVIVESGYAEPGVPLTETTSGEGADLAGLSLGRAQLDLVTAVARTGTPVVTVLVQGRPHLLGEVLDASSAVLSVFYPGPDGGRALARVLTGTAEPTGRLPVSIPQSAAALPVAYNQKDHRFRGYVDADAAPLFPFGHGLGYGQLTIGVPVITTRSGTTGGSGATGAAAPVPAQALREGATVDCAIEVANTGGTRSSTIVQLYLRRLTATSWPRVRELRRFARVTLDPGASTVVHLRLGHDDLAVVTRDLRHAVEPGRYEAEAGASSAALRGAEFEIA